ncbi:hypothetical protein ZEAMMB73_Zm00001d004481 [Zea mays]|uniref:Uncharacterized protein n=1 Tax=Zea mays TaxID=4577 RepID=A0A1D6EFQ2_MAIZE|nr:hypothetical protein ZEAMMB73_Zm00001d004481 [Zea mays]
MDLLEKMMGRGVLSDLQNFSGLMEHLASVVDLNGMAGRLDGIYLTCGICRLTWIWGIMSVS